MSGWTNKDINRRFGVTKVTDTVHDIVNRPVFDEEIRFKPNQISDIPPQFKRYRFCVVCMQPFEFDERLVTQKTQCPNGHGFLVQRKGFGLTARFDYRYMPKMDLGTRYREINIAPLVEKVQAGTLSINDSPWGKSNG